MLIIYFFFNYRNQQLCTDLNSVNKKNSFLKSSLEQNERKLSSSLERERQLKEKNEQLLQQLKAEKEVVCELFVINNIAIINIIYRIG